MSPWLGQATRLDATELPGLDNLHQATDCILQSQERTASYYGARATYYSVNGSTACVMAAIHACVRRNRRQVVLLGPCHVSVWRGLAHADALPVWIPSAWWPECQTFYPPRGADLHAVLRDRADVACVVVTSPSYQGFLADIAEMVHIAHEYGVPVIVDEAHGAHLGLTTGLHQHSVQLGADIVVQSPHKTLPCLTQAAWVHVAGDVVDPAQVREALNFLQTTSPSYLLLAALDAAQAWLHGEGPEAASATLARLARYRDPDIHTAQGIKADPMRMWIPTGRLELSLALNDVLVKQGVFLEYADGSGALAIFGFGQPIAELERFFSVYQHWRDANSLELAEPHMDSVGDLYRSVSPDDLVLTPREAWLAPGRLVSLADAVGRPLKRAIAPYPPGVPMLWPGQVVQGHHVERIRALSAAGLTVLGVSDHEQIEVCDDVG